MATHHGEGPGTMRRRRRQGAMRCGHGISVATAAWAAAEATSAAAAAARAAGRVLEAASLVAAARAARAAGDLLATCPGGASSSSNVEEEVDARLAALRVTVRAQVKAEQMGQPSHTAASLAQRDANVMANAARHHFDGSRFADLTPAAVRRAQRGKRQHRSDLSSSSMELREDAGHALAVVEEVSSATEFYGIETASTGVQTDAVVAPVLSSDLGIWAEMLVAAEGLREFEDQFAKNEVVSKSVRTAPTARAQTLKAEVSNKRELRAHPSDSTVASGRDLEVNSGGGLVCGTSSRLTEPSHPWCDVVSDSCEATAEASAGPNDDDREVDPKKEIAAADPALGEYVDAMGAFFVEGNSDQQSFKRSFAKFLRDRIAEGNDRSDARAEAASLVKDSKETMQQERLCEDRGVGDLLEQHGAQQAS